MGTPHLGSIIAYTCNFGYAIDGDSTATCLENGVWSIEAPKCVPSTLMMYCVINKNYNLNADI